MPESRYVSSGRIKRLIVFCAVAFVVLLVIATLLPAGVPRNALVRAWLVLFPLGGWLVFRRA